MLQAVLLVCQGMRIYCTVVVLLDERSLLRSLGARVATSVVMLLSTRPLLLHGYRIV